MKKQLLLTLLCAMLGGVVQADNVMEKAKSLGHTKFYTTVKDNGQLWGAATMSPDVDHPKNMSPFRVFVPTNDAMKAMDGLDEEGKEELIKLHVSPLDKDAFNSNEALADGDLPTVAGDAVVINGTTASVEESSVTANIVGTPHRTKNGIVHVIDAVLKP